MHRRLGWMLLTPLLALAGGCGDGDAAAPRATAMPTPSATATRTAAATVSATAPATATAQPTATDPAPTASATPTASLQPSATFTASATPTSTQTPTITRTATTTLTPTPSATPRPPEIALVGVVRADDLVQEVTAVDAQGRAVFARSQGQGMSLFVEVRRGTYAISQLAFDPDGAAAGVEFLVSRPLGDGSLAVCDYDPPLIGGVPGVDPPVFDESALVADAVADLGCRVNDGTGQPRSRSSEAACTRDLGALYGFIDSTAERQFCLPIAKAWAFPPGDTIVAVRVRDVRGNASAPREIVIRVAGDAPFDCDDGLGERVFRVARPGSALLTSVQAGDASIDPWIADPLRLCAGPDLGAGLHALTLREDMRFGVKVVDGTVLCGKILARGSAGVLDCEGGTPQDVLAVADQATGRITTDSGLGLPAGTGAASLRAPVALRTLPAGASPTDCLRASFGSEFTGVLTTARGTAEVLDADEMPLATLSSVGLPFSCRDWQTSGGAALVLPIPAVGTAVGDVAATLVLAE